MKLLLDTHTLVWWLTDDASLSEAASDAIDAVGNSCLVSSASAWEIATKVRLGRWPEAQLICDNFTSLIAANNFLSLPMTEEHALIVGGLVGAHKDPFDRVLAAQAKSESATLLTCDQAFGKFGIHTLW